MTYGEQVRQLLEEAANDEALAGLPPAHKLTFHVWHDQYGYPRFTTMDFEGAKPDRKAHAGDRRGGRA